jgi:hypothetical protein
MGKKVWTIYLDYIVTTRIKKTLNIRKKLVKTAKLFFDKNVLFEVSWRRIMSGGEERGL